MEQYLKFIGYWKYKDMELMRTIRYKKNEKKIRNSLRFKKVWIVNDLILLKETVERALFDQKV